MSNGMRIDPRGLPLHMQEHVAISMIPEMKKCDPRAFARCPYQKSCGSLDDAQFPQGSDCDLFNQKVLSSKSTNADHIRGMSDMELATFLYTATRACADHNCGGCPIGEENCPVLLHWLRQPEMEGI